MGRVAAIALFLVLVLLAGGSMAGAHPPGVPKTVMRTGTAERVGKLVSATWTSFDGQFCLTQISDGSPIFPRAAGWKPGNKIKIQLRKKQRPDQLTIRGWTQLQHERPVGAGDLIDYALKSRLRNGSRIWIASFTPRIADHLYLQVRSNWVATGSECGGVQLATWQFHVKRA